MSEKETNGHEEICDDEILEAEEIPLEAEELEEEEIQEEEELTEEERLRRALAESDDRYLRLAAEYDNYRKRTSKEISESYPRATCETVAKFLPVLDDFQRSLEFDPKTDAFAEGIDLIEQGFEDTLKNLGVETFGEAGDAFDPNLHNAIMHVEDEKFGANEVSMVLQKGYKIGDRIIRHAMVQTAN